MKEITYKVGDQEMKLSGTEILGASAVDAMKRIEGENLQKSTTEIKLDKSNKVSFPGFPYKFEALGGKILVSIDVYKSGYECRECLGKGKIKTMCGCERNNHAGLKYSEEELLTVRDTLGEDIAYSRQTMVCPDCNGNYEEQRGEINCYKCKGIGHILVIPESSKNLPTSGVVVSLGSDILEDDDGLKYMQDSHGIRRYLGYTIGDRILFGPYAGNMIPTKAGLMFKIIDAVQAWCKIEGGEELSAFDFIIEP